MNPQAISQIPPGADITRTPDAKIVTINMTGGGVNIYMCPPDTPLAITSQTVMNNTPASLVTSVTDTYPVPDTRTGVSLSTNSDNPYLPNVIAKNL